MYSAKLELNEVNKVTFSTSPLCTSSIFICFSDNISRSGPTVTRMASVAFNDNSFESASDVFPYKKQNQNMYGVYSEKKCNESVKDTHFCYMLQPTTQ